MANWFKIYETDLDEKRLKYALNKLPEVGWVWIGILSECCKHRSDTIRYSQSEVDLFGFSDALKVSIPKINAAINLLSEIQYITKTDTQITVTRWREKQSEYNHRKQRGDYRIISDNSGEYPLEERRGEEKRVEENKQREREEALPEIPPMSRKAFDDLCQMRAVPPDCAEWFWNTHDGRNWTDKTGQPIRKVEPLLLNALKNWRAKQSQHSAQSQPSGKPTVFAITKIMEAKKQRADDLKSRHAIETGLDTTWNDPKARAEWKALRAEIKTLNTQLSQMA